MEPLRTPPRSIASSSGMPNPSFGPEAIGASDGGVALEPGLEAGPHFESPVGNAHGMQPAHRAAAAQFQDANMAERPQLRNLVGEMQHPVDHRVFGKESALPLRVGQQDRRCSA